MYVMVTPGRVTCSSVSCAMESLGRLSLSAPGEGSGLGAAAAAAGLGDGYSLPAPSTCWARVLGSIAVLPGHHHHRRLAAHCAGRHENLIAKRGFAKKNDAARQCSAAKRRGRGRASGRREIGGQGDAVAVWHWAKADGDGAGAGSPSFAVNPVSAGREA